MEILGYICSLLIGLSLGLLGAGGSILTLPVLVYLFRIEPMQAIKYSLFIVGVSSIGSIYPKFRKKEVLVIEGLCFALISGIIVWLVRRLLLPYIPSVIYRAEHYTITFSTLSMLIFAGLMLWASGSMIGNKAARVEKKSSKRPRLLLLATASAVGLVTGLFGAGGGFLIVPAMVIIFSLDIKYAIGTSLLIISLNSMIGFLCEIDKAYIDWVLLLKIISISLIGSFIGQWISKHIDPNKLKICFGWFLVVIGVMILITQCYHLLITNI